LADIVQSLGGDGSRAPEEDDREKAGARLAEPGAGETAERCAHERGDSDPY
jgi:hypothetical protein